jgi:hypothetical protein
MYHRRIDTTNVAHERFEDKYDLREFLFFSVWVRLPLVAEQ